MEAWSLSHWNTREILKQIISLHMVTAAVKLKDFCALEKAYDKPRQRVKKQRHYFANKGLYGPSYGFPSSHVWI